MSRPASSSPPSPATTTNKTRTSHANATTKGQRSLGENNQSFSAPTKGRAKYLGVVIRVSKKAYEPHWERTLPLALVEVVVGVDAAVARRFVRRRL